MEGKILRLWQALVIITIFTAALLFQNNQSLHFSLNSQTTEVQKKRQSQAVINRDLIARDFRTTSEVEVYYGKPGIFNLEEMLKSQNIIVYPEDVIQTFPDPSFGVGSQITVFRATPVILLDGNNKTIYRTWKKTISELLEEKRIEIGDKDIIEPALSTAIVFNLEIKITRVSETNVTEKISLDFKTTKKEDPNLEKGKSYVAQSGKRGIKERIFKVRRENGVEVSRVLLEEKITKEPQDEIIIYGTKIISYGEGYATWYSWVSGNVAAHKTLPLGTKVKVVNLQNGRSIVVTIVDRGPFGGAIIDLSKESFASIGSLGSGKIWVRLEKAE